MEKWKIDDFKKKFQECVDSESDWRREAKEDYEFLSGKQWDDSDRNLMKQLNRPAVTINRLLSMLNVLSGHQRNNRTDINFLGRNPDDQDGATLRKGITKYILDDNDFEFIESGVFEDGAAGGRAFAMVEVLFDPYTLKPKVNIEKVSPFDIFVDPESRDDNYKDAKYMFRSRWVDKDDLASRYPEHKDAILASQNEEIDNNIEDGGKTERQEYKSRADKIRIIECWYKRSKKKEAVMNSDGTVDIQDVNKDAEEMLYPDVEYKTEIKIPQVYMCIYFGSTILEHRESPYNHGEFPYAPYTGYYFGNDDIPAGIVRHLKDVQRFGNKTISQALDIVNHQLNGVTRLSPGVPEEEVRKIENEGTKPGVVVRVGQGDFERIPPPQVPNGLFQVGGSLFDQLTDVNGMNADFLASTDVSKNTSGKAIELRQKTAVTHVAKLLDNLKMWKKHIARLLWGDDGKQGIIPQYFTEEMYFRIAGPNGKYDFIKVNEETMLIDQSTGMPIYDPYTQRTLTTIKNSLDQTGYDIIISDSPTSETIREAQLQALIELGGQMGLSQNPMLQPLVFKTAIELSDYPDIYKEPVLASLNQQIAMNQAMMDIKLAEAQAQMMQVAQGMQPQQPQQGGPPQLPPEAGLPIGGMG